MAVINHNLVKSTLAGLLLTSATYVAASEQGNNAALGQNTGEIIYLLCPKYPSCPGEPPAIIIGSD